MQPQNPPAPVPPIGPQPPVPPQPLYSPQLQPPTPHQPTFTPPAQPTAPPQPASALPAQPAAPPQPDFTQQVPPAAPNMQLNPAYSHDKLAVASLILGIVSLPASILNILTLPIPVTGMVLGFISLKRNKGFALAGIILSFIGIVLSGLVLAIGVHVLNSKSTIKTSSSHSVSGPKVTSTCYSFRLPSPFKAADITKNSDCVTNIIVPTDTDDIAINSTSLSHAVSNADHDRFLKNLSQETENIIGSKANITTRKFIQLDGVRAYQVTGTEDYGQYNYIGFIVALAPQDYVSVTGAKLRAFLIAYDSATSQDRLDEIAQSWHWQ